MSTTSPTTPTLTVEDAYRPLHQEVSNIHLIWMQFRQLFGTSPERVDLLNRTAGLFFGTVQRVMNHAVVLAIFRLADPPTQGKDRDNLTLERLADIVEADWKSRPKDGFPSPVPELRVLVADLRAGLRPYQPLRNKVIAHNDLRTARASYDETSAVPRPSRLEIETALCQIRDFMNTVGRCCLNEEAIYPDTSIPFIGSGEDLIRCLSAERLGR